MWCWVGKQFVDGCMEGQNPHYYLGCNQSVNVWVLCFSRGNGVTAECYMHQQLIPCVQPYFLQHPQLPRTMCSSRASLWCCGFPWISTWILSSTYGINCSGHWAGSCLHSLLCRCLPGHCSAGVEMNSIGSCELFGPLNACRCQAVIATWGGHTNHCLKNAFGCVFRLSLFHRINCCHSQIPKHDKNMWNKVKQKIMITFEKLGFCFVFQAV